MSKHLILDSSALLAVFFKEIGASVVLDGMRDAQGENYIHGFNACEVAYNLIRRGCPPELAWKSSPPVGVHQIDDVKGAVGERAVALKSAPLFLSLGDCFAISLAELLEGRILTGDKRFAEAKTTSEVVLIR